MNEETSNTELPHEPSPRGKELAEWIKQLRTDGDHLTVDKLRQHILDINEHYNLYRNDKK
jgi:hypothetical protein